MACKFTGIFQLGAWHYSLILGPWCWGNRTGPALLSFLPGSGGAEQQPLANKCFYWGGETFPTVETRRIQTYLSQRGMEPHFSTANLFLLAPSCGQASFLWPWLIPFSPAPLPCLMGCHHCHQCHSGATKGQHPTESLSTDTNSLPRGLVLGPAGTQPSRGDILCSHGASSQ